MKNKKEDITIFNKLLVEKKDDANVLIQGLPFENNLKEKDALKATDVLREESKKISNFTKDAEKINVKIFDLGDFSVKKHFHEAAYKQILSNYKSGKFNIFFGGDHSISIATEKAFIDYSRLYKAEPVVIHIGSSVDLVDADFDTQLSSNCVNRRALDNGLEPKNLYLVGSRDFREDEVDYIFKHRQVHVYSSSMIEEAGFKRVLADLKSNDNQYMIYHISIGMDCLDPMFAPGVNNPSPIGLNSKELVNFIKDAVTYLNVISLDFTEINPKNDIQNITSKLALKMLYEVLHVFGKKGVPKLVL